MRTIKFTNQKIKPSNNSYRKVINLLIFLCLTIYLQAQTYTYLYTGSEQTFIVPTGVTSVDIEVWGAQGGKGFMSTEGGLGGYASGTLAVSPGQTLYVYVGGKGGTHASGTITGGGFNGGGDSRGVNNLVGGGGGASDVRVGGNTFNDRVIVGGGGGGTCGVNSTGGNGGGTQGAQGTSLPNDNPGGGGGTQNSGGSSASCEMGTFGIGGSSTLNAQCAGGGGGWYGGGAGCGAGGGSGYIGGVTNGSIISGIRSGNGIVWIHFNTTQDNDFCNDATPISCGEIIIGNTAGAGIEHPPACGVDVGQSGGRWYSFLGTGENVTFSTCNPGTDFNTQISVYIGTCDELICVDSNDDAPGCNGGSQLTIPTIMGALYRILINGAGTAEGNYELSVICPPDNDIPEDAQNISCGTVASGSTIGAIPPDPSLPFCGLSNGTGGAVWYTFEGDGGCFDLSTCSPNTNFDIQITVYTGSPGNLVCFAANNDGCSGSMSANINIPTSPNTDYYVMIHGFGDSAGSFELELTCVTPPLLINCPPDITLACGESVPPAASNRVAFIAQGGSILGGSCVAGNNSYNITFEDLIEGDDCDGIIVERVYTVTNIITDLEATCSQEFTIPPNPDFTIECAPEVDVECAEDIVVSPMDLVVNLNCLLGYSVDIEGPFTDGASNCPGTTHMYIYTVTLDGCGAQMSCKRAFTIVNSIIPEIICPPDITVSCEDEINLDPNDAIINTGCDLGYNVYIRNPSCRGIPGCDGTMYRYEYVVVDGCGRSASCIQVVTISNTPASINVPDGGTVECFEDIDLNLSDATVINDCADYSLYLSAPTINGELACPGTTYTFTFRLIDVCGNIVEEDVVYTNADNEAPNIEAPIDITCECLAGINPNPDHATVTTGCSAGSTVTVSGPQIIGPLDCPGTQYIYTYTVSDNCGRTDSDVQIFTVQNGPPVFENCPDDNWLQLNCEDYGGESGTIAVVEAWIASVSARSSCGIPLNVLNDFDPNNFGTCINDGYTTVNFFATDDCGRTTICQGIVVVTDTEAPTIYEPAQDHWEICNYNSPDNFQAWLADQGGAEAEDACSIDNISWSTIPANPTFNCMGASGTTSVTVTFLVEDNCGNSTSTTATFNALMSGNDMIANEDDRPLNEKGNIGIELADKIKLQQNRPNPFKDKTVIGFHLPEATKVTLTIFDLNGKVLKRIEGNYDVGYNEVFLKKSDLNAVGLLYYQLMTKQESITKSMLIIE